MKSTNRGKWLTAWFFAFLYTANIGSAASSEHRNTGMELRGDVPEFLAAPGEYILQMDSELETAEMESVFSEKLNTSNVKVEKIPNSTINILRIPKQKGGWVNLNDYLEMLKNTPGVQKAQPNYIRYTSSLQANLDDPMLPKQWYLESINAHKAWAVNQNASDVTVAVIDDAIMIEHEDIKGNLWSNPGEIPGNGKDDDGNGYIDDIHGWNFADKNNDPSPVGACVKSGHGTHVSGAIGAVGGNSKGISGVAPKSRIMALAIGNSKKNCSLDSLGILEAVRYAIDNGAKIINLSLGGPVGAPIAEATYRLASDKGVLLVIAAGNDGLSNDMKDIPSHSQFTLAIISRQNKVIHYAIAPQYPAAFSQSIDGILTVANLAKTDNTNVLLKQRKYQYDSIGYNARLENGKLKIDRRVQLNQEKWYVGSNYGVKSVHIGSPGTDIYSTIPKNERGHVVSAYTLMTGTSMASPITAGAAALVWSAFPNMNNIEVKERLLASVNKNPDLNGNLSSEGELDLFKALCGEEFSQRAAGCPSSGGTKKKRNPRENDSSGKPKEKTKPQTPGEKNNKPQYSNRDDEMNSWLTDDNSGSEQATPQSGGIKW